MNKDEARLSVMGAISMALKDPTLQQGFEIICKNLTELEKENKTVSRKANEAIADKLLITSKYNEALNDLNQENDKLKKENAELKCECGRCVYTDSPCILSDYGKDKNGICDHFKNVFDENAELKSRDCWKSCEYANPKTELIGQHIKDVQNLTKAKEIIKYLLSFIQKENYRTRWDINIAEAEQFISEVEK